MINKIITPIFHLALSALFFYAAWLQLNDPDPVFWLLLYGLTGVVCFARFFAVTPIVVPKKAHLIASGLALLVCIAGVLVSVGGGLEYLNHFRSESLIQDMSPSRPYIEQTRELIGSLFSAVIVALYGFSAALQKG